MLSKINAPPDIHVPSPCGLPLPNPTPNGRPSSRSDLLRKNSPDDLRGDPKPSLVSGEVQTMRMLFGGSICLLFLCITMLIIVSCVPLRNAAAPLSKHHRSTSHHKKLSNPFHFLDGPLEAFGSIDGMVLEGMKTPDGTPVERYYRIQRVTRIPVVYQQGEEGQNKSVRVEFFGGDFIIADKLSAALFRRRDVDENSELECAPLMDDDTTIEGKDNDVTATTTPPSVYCAVALIINSEMQGNLPTEADASSSSNHTRGLQGRTSINFPYRDGSIYSSPYGQFQFNTGRIFRNGVTWGIYDRYRGFEHWD